jgi:hypothetical protein
MKRVIITMLLLGGFVPWSTMEAGALVCAAGVYRAGCVAARDAVVVRAPVYGRARIAVVPHRAIVRR